MKRITLPFLLSLCLAACTGNNVDRENRVEEESTNRVEATMATDLKQETPQPIARDINVAEGGAVNLTVGDTPKATTEATQEKATKSDSMLDMSIKELYSMHSGWFYLIVAISLAIVVFLWLRIRNTSEYKVAAEGVKKTGEFLGYVTDKLRHLTPDTPEYRAWSEMESAAQKRHVEASQKAPPKYFI